MCHNRGCDHGLQDIQICRKGNMIDHPMYLSAFLNYDSVPLLGWFCERCAILFDERKVWIKEMKLQVHMHMCSWDLTVTTCTCAPCILDQATSAQIAIDVLNGTFDSGVCVGFLASRNLLVKFSAQV